MKKMTLMLMTLALLAGVTLAERPFYRNYTMGTNGILSVTNNFTAGAAQNQLLVQLPDYALLTFYAALPVSTVTVSRVTSSNTWSAVVPTVIPTNSAQGLVVFTKLCSYRNGDVFTMQLKPAPTSTVPVEVGYK